ncbi:MAG: hypothetical protein JSW00_16675 [Thermoplasmata archaeon]|nr:MAG: hypothetical protein JSW00_16675 [Thermoplasmata archaeon]
MKEKTRFMIGAILLTSIAVCQFSASLYFLFIIEDRDVALAWFGVSILSMLVFAVILKKGYTDMKQEMPSEDERSLKIRMFAAGYTYFFSLFWWLALMFVNDLFATCEQLIGIGVLGMCVIFGSWWGYLSKRGDVI